MRLPKIIKNKKFLISFGIALVIGGTAFGYYLVSSNNNESASVGMYDFGDAPDNSETNYEIGAINGAFPSLLESNGARVIKTDEAWLGKSVDQEPNAKITNQDKNDDGFQVQATSCSESTASYVVHLPKKDGKVNTKGKAYLNLLVDWDKDGTWNGEDKCASEWAIKNYEIDLSKQTNEVQVYEIKFPAGNFNDKIQQHWLRATLTYKQKIENTNGGGSYSSGEIEDYGPGKVGDNYKDYAVYCDPYPLNIDHGKSGIMTIKEEDWSEKIKELQFDPIYLLYGLSSDVRDLTAQGNTITYTSKKIDGPKRTDTEYIYFNVSYNDGEYDWGWCKVNVNHEEVTKITPTPTHQSPTTIETKVNGYTELSPAKTELAVDVIPAQIGSSPINKIVIDLSPIPSTPNQFVGININQGGWEGTDGAVSDWECSVAGKQATCQGVTPLFAGKKSIFYFYYSSVLNQALNLNLNIYSGLTLLITILTIPR